MLMLTLLHAGNSSAAINGLQMNEAALTAFHQRNHCPEDAQTTIQNATLVISHGKMVAVGANVAVRRCGSDRFKGKYIYRRL